MLLASGILQFVEGFLAQAFYPSLLGILVIASLGLPIPEDIPLIAAGVVLRTHPDVASWPLTIFVALVGIMSGDLVLYTMGRLWGNDLLSHRFVRLVLSAERYEKMRGEFHRHGVWMCFFGRFFMGIRAAMCLTAGATHFPYWKFFLADFAGALLSVPLFIGLGYAFAGMIPTLMEYTESVQLVLLALVLVAAAALVWRWRVRRARRAGAAAVGAANSKAAESPAA